MIFAPVLLANHFQELPKLYRAVSTSFTEAADRAKKAQKSEVEDDKKDCPIPICPVDRLRPWDIPADENSDKK
jgi:hypothetical protein